MLQCPLKKHNRGNYSNNVLQMWYRETVPVSVPRLSRNENCFVFQGHTWLAAVETFQNSTRLSFWKCIWIAYGLVSNLKKPSGKTFDQQFLFVVKSHGIEKLQGKNHLWACLQTRTLSREWIFHDWLSFPPINAIVKLLIIYIYISLHKLKLGGLRTKCF